MTSKTPDTMCFRHNHIPQKLPSSGRLRKLLHNTTDRTNYQLCNGCRRSYIIPFPTRTFTTFQVRQWMEKWHRDHEWLSTPQELYRIKVDGDYIYESFGRGFAAWTRTLGIVGCKGQDDRPYDVERAKEGKQTPWPHIWRQGLTFAKFRASARMSKTAGPPSWPGYPGTSDSRDTY